MTIATPPPRGVGVMWELLEFGMSIRLRPSAYFRSTQVRKNDSMTTASIIDASESMYGLIKIV